MLHKTIHTKGIAFYCGFYDEDLHVVNGGFIKLRSLINSNVDWVQSQKMRQANYNIANVTLQYRIVILYDSNTLRFF